MLMPYLASDMKMHDVNPNRGLILFTLDQTPIRDQSGILYNVRSPYSGV